MPGREPWTYGNWSSDVTARAKSTTNRGRTEAAGVMPGARASDGCFKGLSLGECCK